MPTKAELEAENVSLTAQLAAAAATTDEARNPRYPRGEQEWRQTKGGYVVTLFNSAAQGYAVAIDRPDGTFRVRKVGNPDEAREAVGNIVDGEFN